MHDMDAMMSDPARRQKMMANRLLLLSSSRLTLAHGQSMFVLLTLPGERRDAHPPRRDAAFGLKYDIGSRTGTLCAAIRLAMVAS